MAWDLKRRGVDENGPWSFLSHNLSFALLILLAVLLLLAGRAQGSWTDAARSFLQDIVSPFFTMVAGPSNAASRWAEGLGGAFDVYGENQRLREENRELLAFKNAAIELRQRVTRYEALLNAGPQPGSAFVTGRVIADSGGAFQNTLIVGAGRAMGVAKGQAVTTEQGLVGHIVNAGNHSARILLLTDASSRIPVRLERANVKAILTGDGSATPYLDFLPRGTLLVAGDRVVTSSDGGVFPPGLPVGTVGENGSGGPRVALFTDERRADFVRIIRYEAPVDADIGAPEPLPGARPARPPEPPLQEGPPVVAGAPETGPATSAPVAAPASPAPPVESGSAPGTPADTERR
jgi:rod shape-determining protein MreC